MILSKFSSLRSTSKESAPSLDRRAYDFLKSHPVGVLTTVDPDHNPHGAAIFFAVEPGTLEITFLTKRHTKKSDNLAYSDRAMLVVFDVETQTTVQISGITSELKDADASGKVFRNTLRASQQGSKGAIPPVIKLHAGPFAAYRLRPVQVRLSTYAHPDVRIIGPNFQTLNLPI